MKTPTLDQLVAAVTKDLERGVWSVPLREGAKRPKLRGWNHLRIGAEDAEDFFEAGMNRGRLLGVEPATGEHTLVVVDLDVPEALAMAPHLLPATGEVGGRSGAPRAHWYYACTHPPPTRRYNGADGERLVELLSRGSQVVVPPSIHPSGDAYQWFEDGPAAAVNPAELQARCAELAVACALVRGTPDPVAALMALGNDLDNDRCTRIRAAVEVCSPASDGSGPVGGELNSSVRQWLGETAGGAK